MTKDIFTVFLTLGCAVLFLVVSSSCVPVATNQDKFRTQDKGSSEAQHIEYNLVCIWA